MEDEVEKTATEPSKALSVLENKLVLMLELFAGRQMAPRNGIDNPLHVLIVLLSSDCLRFHAYAGADQSSRDTSKIPARKLTSHHAQFSENAPSPKIVIVSIPLILYRFPFSHAR